MRFPAPGLAGGLPGAPGDLLFDGAPMVLEPFVFDPGHVVTLMLPGGGGFGDPRQRDPARLAEDVRLGFVTPAAAFNDYGAADQAAAAD
jgi:N-methylhydantoinase B